jgi:hypothetical protein
LSRDRLAPFLHYSEQDAGNRDPQKREALFKAATGMDYPAMVERLRHYVRDGKYGMGEMAAPRIASSESYGARAVPRDEIRGQLIELDFRTNRSALAKLALLDRIGRNPGDTRAYEALGTDALLDGDEAMARDRWEQALAAGSHNPGIFHELGVLENRQWFSQVDLIYFRLPDDAAQHLRMLLKRSIENAPQQVQAYEMLAWVEATVDHPQISNVNLVQAHFPKLVEKSRTLLALALVRVRLKDDAGARQLLDSLADHDPDPDIVRDIAGIKRYLDSRAEAAAEEKP